MSNRAEERALQRYALREITGESVKLHDEYVCGYEQAEKDTIERALEWLKYAEEKKFDLHGAIAYFKAIMEDER